MDLRQAWDDSITFLLSDNSTLPQSALAFLPMCQFVGEFNDLAMINVPNEFVKSKIESKCLQHIENSLSIRMKRQIRLGIMINDSLENSSDTHTPPHQDEPHSNETSYDFSYTHPSYNQPISHTTPTYPAYHTSSHSSAPSHSVQEPSELSGYSPYPPQSSHGSSSPVIPDQTTNLNPHYTFDTFVIGASNRFAHAAATAVAEAPAKAYNPLFIYGGSGLGKTHLLHAIGLYAMNLFPNIKVKYVNSEEFTNDFINSISRGKAYEFQQRYREVDILLIDDIQFLQGKEQTIEEFFHTFNTLHNARKQVVITSDLPPKDLNGFEERLRSRFEWGLTTDVQPPDLETRIAILRNRFPQETSPIPDTVLEYVASRVVNNIRELEGAMLRITAFSSLNKQPVDLELAQLVIKDLISDPNDHEITPSVIKVETAKYFDITVTDLCSSARSKPLSEARQIAMYLCRELTDLSLPRIGQAFGGRDHTTVMHATKKIPERMKENPAIYNHVTELTNLIRQAARHPRD